MLVDFYDFFYFFLFWYDLLLYKIRSNKEMKQAKTADFRAKRYDRGWSIL
jgi:hypothetical protein